MTAPGFWLGRRISIRYQEDNRDTGTLKIARLQTGMLSNPREHSWSNFLAVMEGENKIDPSFAHQNPV
jgi:hypothetical protein